MSDPNTASMWSATTSVMQCVLTSLKGAQNQLGLKQEQLDRLAAAAQKYAKAVVNGAAIRLAADALWQIGDLLGDWYAHRNTANGNGFNVIGKEPAPVATTPPPPNDDDDDPWPCHWIPIINLIC